MRDTLKVAVLAGSTVIAAAHFILSIVIVPHIFGLLISGPMFLIGVLGILYFVKVKKAMKQDYKVQYEMMGKKENDSCYTKSILICLRLMFVSANALMLTMIVLRAISLTKPNEVTSFPYACNDYSGRGCARIVMQQNSCFRTESLANSYTLVYLTKANNHNPVPFYINYCAQTISINQLKYPKEWPSMNSSSGFIHEVVESMFFGFIDDVYIQWRPYGSQYTIIEVQSEPRVGKSDF